MAPLFGFLNFRVNVAFHKIDNLAKLLLGIAAFLVFMHFATTIIIDDWTSEESYLVANYSKQGFNKFESFLDNH